MDGFNHLVSANFISPQHLPDDLDAEGPHGFDGHIHIGKRGGTAAQLNGHVPPGVGRQSRTAFIRSVRQIRKEKYDVVIDFHGGPRASLLAFFSGAIDAAGSFGGIYQSSVYAYGAQLVPSPIDGEKFLDLTALKAIDAAGTYKDQKIAIAPIRSSATTSSGSSTTHNSSRPARCSHRSRSTRAPLK
jgi:hypothetical protein